MHIIHTHSCIYQLTCIDCMTGVEPACLYLLQSVVGYKNLKLCFSITLSIVAHATLVIILVTCIGLTRSSAVAARGRATINLV